MTSENRHVTARWVDSEWCEDSSEIELLRLEHQQLETAVRGMRTRQKELSERASELRLARQAEINAAISDDDLDKLARQLLDILRQHGPGWEGSLTEGLVNVWMYDMHKTAVRSNSMWTGWSAPWAHAADGAGNYPIVKEKIEQACLRVGLGVETWYSDIGVSCVVKYGWAS